MQDHTNTVKYLVNREGPAGLPSGRPFWLNSTIVGRLNSVMRQVFYLPNCEVSSKVRFSDMEPRSKPPTMVRLGRGVSLWLESQEAPIVTHTRTGIGG